MTFDNDRARSLWAETRIRVWPEPVVLASLPTGRAAEAAALAGRERSGFAAVVVEREEVSLTLPEATWRSCPLRDEAFDEEGPFRVLTFDLSLELDVCGYLAPAATALAAAGVPIVPQCGFRTDPLLVPAERVDGAIEVLERLVARAREVGAP